MKIEELISGKGNGDKVSVGGLSLIVSALKKFMADGYIYIRPYEAERTVSMWGKACTGCFTEQEVTERA
jgi:hypothetical protein